MFANFVCIMMSTLYANSSNSYIWDNLLINDLVINIAQACKDSLEHLKRRGKLKYSSVCMHISPRTWNKSKFIYEIQVLFTTVILLKFLPYLL